MATTSDAHAPLLPQNAEATTIIVREPEDEDEASEKPPANESWGGTASIKSASFNMTNTMLGAGIMALPYAMKTMGIVMGTLALLGVTILTRSSLRGMLRCMEVSRQYTYSNLVYSALGHRGRDLLRFAIVINNLGLLIAYLIIMGDVLCGSHDGLHTGLIDEWFGQRHVWYTSRKFVVSAIVVGLLLPLSSFRRMDALSFTSALSVTLALLAVCTTVYLAGVKVFQGQATMPRWLPEGTGLFTFFSILPVVANAYICHYNVFPIYRELRSPSKEKMRVVVTNSVYVVGFSYVLFSCAAYTLFGDATSTDILQNFDRDISKIIHHVVILTSAVRLGYVVTLVLTFPLIVFAVRNILDAVIFSDTDRFEHIRFIVLTCGMLAFVVFGSIMVPNIWVAFQFTGSTAAVIIGFILPGLVALKTDGAVTRVSHNRSAWSLLAVGATVSILGVATNIWGVYRNAKGSD